MPSVDHLYRYAGVSALEGSALTLVTSGGVAPHPFFFEGDLKAPRRVAPMLLALGRVVGSRFYVPPAMLARILAEADPVVTSGGGRLRFEGFSACASAYARVDLLPDAYDGDLVSSGTTNVDFNPPTRAALAGVRERLALSVGRHAVALAHDAGVVVERKVALPLRWLKGFVEVQAIQARMRPRLALTGPEAARFLRSLPRGTTKQATWVVPSGRSLRLSSSAAPGGVRVAGFERLRVLEALAPLARDLRVYADEIGHGSAWELDLGDARFTLVVSGEVWRGFSGEGQVLDALVSAPDPGLLARLRAALRWQASIDLDGVAAEIGVARAPLESALATLGTRGLVGYDLAEGAWFHRELPFDLSKVDAMHPRLEAARKLVALVRLDGDEADVPGTGVVHRVRLGDAPRCTCPWYAKHQGDRGPCKHVLAAQLAQEGA